MVHFPPKKLWVNFLFVKKHQTGGWGGRGRLGKSPHFPKEDLFGKTPLFPMFEFSLQSFGHETKLFPVGGSIVQVTFVSWHHCIVFIFGQALMVEPQTGDIVANADFRKGGGVAGF